jgi:hypothetical protein
VDSSRKRDESIERLLRQSLKAPQRADATDGCLDGETLAAMMEGGLSEPALNAAQSHVADCARCQSLVGAMARIDTVAPAETKHARGWLRWAVPLTAAAAGVAIWVAVPRRDLVPLPQPMEVQRQAADQSQPAPAPPASPSAPADRIQSSAKENIAKQPPQRADTFAKQESAAAPADAAAAPPSSNALGTARLRAGLAEAITIEVISPDPMIRWRISGSTVQRSIDGGAQWEIQPTGAATELTAGSAPLPSVAWIVGRGGTVILSVDGRSWRRVPFPEMTDLSAVRARDARSASVTTADGRTFSTTDAGSTWVPRPLQDF